MTDTLDTYGRYLKYLRISVTDRCNFRCLYCMPQNNFTHIDSEEILRYEDILFVTEIFAELGVNRVRITGGEPLVRKGLCGFLSKLSKIENIDEIMLTTNGTLLNKFASELLDAGVTRLNISLDSLRKDRADYITGVSKFEETIDGIKMATKMPFKQIKVNAVAIKGFNDDEILDFCNFAADNNVIVRFIEFMPIGNSTEWGEHSLITGDEILEKIASLNPKPLIRDINAGPASNYELSNGGTIGIITPMSRHFCSTCDKLRITSDGKIRPCLLVDKEINLADVIKMRDRDGLRQLIIDSLVSKGREHKVSVGENANEYKRTMSKIGG